MDPIRSALFEDPLGVYLILGGIAAILLVVWLTVRTRKAAAAVAVPVALAIAVAVVSTCVVTERERIVEAMEEIAADLESGSVDVLASRVADDYSGVGGGRAEALRKCRRSIDTLGLREIAVRDVQVDVKGDGARMKVKTLILANRPGNLLWHVQWVKRGGRWWIVRASGPKPAQAGPFGI